MNRPRLSPSAYTVAWVTALFIEAAAAAEMLDEEHSDPRNHGSNTDQYTFGRIGSHHVIIACLPSGQMGNNLAAAVAGRLTIAFPSIRFALMVGIGGGVPAAGVDIRLGDVVVSHPHLQHGGVVQYDFGKTGPNGQVQRTGFVNAPPTVLLNAIARLRANHVRGINTVSSYLSTFESLPWFTRNGIGPDILYEAAYHHNGGESCEGCSDGSIVQRPKRDKEDVVIHYGTIASGNQVMKDGISRDRISAELGRVLCFEMEAAGLASTFPCVAIRGICDYADSHKNKSWQPYAAATAAAVAKELLSIVSLEEVGEAEEAGELMSSKRYRVAFSLKGVPVGRFVDRLEDLERISQALLPQTQVGDPRQKIFVLYGLGGIGKTQLAIEFARKYKSAFTSVFWLNGDNEDSLKQSIADCASRIPEGHIPETSRKYSSTAKGDPNVVVRDFMEWLSRTDNTHWLLIFDNVDRDYKQRGADSNAYDVRDYIPHVDHGSTLITTRLTNLQQFGESIRLGSVEISQARAIFRQWYNHDFSPSDSDELLQLLNGLPLALAQTAAFMSETGTSFSTYIRLYKEQWKDLMEDEDTALSGVYGNRTINTTWNVSYNAVREKNRGATNLLLLWSHLDNKTLPYWIFQAGVKGPSTLAEELSEWLEGAANSEVKFLKIIRLLQSYCLVESLELNSSCSTHPVVHQWAFHMQDNDQKAALSRLAIRLIGSAVLDEDAQGYYELQRQLLPHIESWIESTRETILDRGTESEEGMFNALHEIAVLLKNLGKLAEAERMYQRALEGKEKVLGPNHISTFNTVNNLGVLYTNQGKLAEAERMYQRALEGKVKALGPDHISTLDTVNNLGSLYDEQGKLAEAEMLYQRALEGKEKALGPNHTSTLDTVNNLGGLYAEQGKLAEAERMYQRALKGYEAAVGPDILSTYVPALNTTYNFALLYEEQGRFSDAKMMYKRALQGFRLVYEMDHQLSQAAHKRLTNLESKEEDPSTAPGTSETG